MMYLIWVLIAVLVVFWLLGAFVVHIGSLIHLLLVIAVIVLIWHLIVNSGPGTRRW